MNQFIKNHKILKNPTIAKAINIVRKDCAGLSIKKAKAIHSGMDNFVVEIDEKYIFRFPREVRYREKLITEAKLLKHFKNKLGVPVPKPLFFGTEYSYMGYTKIPGKPLSKQLYQTFSTKEKGQLAKDCARFLYQFHNRISIRQALGIGLVKGKLSKSVDFSKLKFVKDKAVVSSISNAVKFLKTDRKKYPRKVVYWDLHNHNIIIDPKKKKLTAVIDFGDVGVGDINLDFYQMYKFDLDLMMKIIFQYEKLSGVKLSPFRCLMYATLNEAYYLAKSVNGKTARGKLALKSLKSFIKQQALL